MQKLVWEEEKSIAAHVWESDKSIVSYEWEEEKSISKRYTPVCWRVSLCGGKEKKT